MPTARQEAGRLLIVGIPRPQLDPESREILRRTQPGGVILFARNVEEVDQVLALAKDLRQMVPGVLLYVDAEGGRVDRFKSLLGPGASGAALAASPVPLAHRAGRWMGYGLRCLDCDVNLAPVVDLDLGEQGNALDGRYLGDDPSSVGARARAFLLGLHSSGVAGCIKHYPGLGAARADTHHVGAEIALSAEALAEGLKPFRRLGKLAKAMMASHAVYPGLDSEGLPAGMSRAISTQLLRHQLGFHGVLFSDDLDMHALDSVGSLEQRAVAALSAGCDGIFVCQSLAAAPKIVERLAAAPLAERRQQALVRLGKYRLHVQRLQSGIRRFSLDTVRRHLAKVAERAEGNLR